MLTKKTADNQIGLPREVSAQFEEVEYFDVTTDGVCIQLQPVAANFQTKGDAGREQMRQRGITEEDVEDAVRWARSPEGKGSTPKEDLARAIAMVGTRRKH